MISSTIPGTNPAQIPWVLCGLSFQPDNTGESKGSTATTLIA